MPKENNAKILDLPTPQALESVNLPLKHACKILEGTDSGQDTEAVNKNLAEAEKALDNLNSASEDLAGTVAGLEETEDLLQRIKKLLKNNESYQLVINSSQQINEKTDKILTKQRTWLEFFRQLLWENNKAKVHELIQGSSIMDIPKPEYSFGPNERNKLEKHVYNTLCQTNGSNDAYSYVKEVYMNIMIRTRNYHMGDQNLWAGRIDNITKLADLQIRLKFADEKLQSIKNNISFADDNHETLPFLNIAEQSIHKYGYYSSVEKVLIKELLKVEKVSNDQDLALETLTVAITNDMAKYGTNQENILKAYIETVQNITKGQNTETYLKSLNETSIKEIQQTEGVKQSLENAKNARFDTPRKLLQQAIADSLETQSGPPPTRSTNKKVLQAWKEAILEHEGAIGKESIKTITENALAKLENKSKKQGFVEKVKKSLNPRSMGI